VAPKKPISRASAGGPGFVPPMVARRLYNGWALAPNPARGGDARRAPA
jgi:hypothetical protein